MDGMRFDDVSRALARGTSRRAVLKGLFAGVAAAAGLRALPDSADAATCTPPGPRNFCNFDVECCSGSLCRNGACSCPAGKKICGSGCIDESQTCGPSYCPAGFKVCGGICKDTSRDPQNCGSCGIVCGPTKTCSNGRCCPKGTVFCNGTCKPSTECELIA
jgi:hypothetical protein